MNFPDYIIPSEYNTTTFDWLKKVSSYLKSHETMVPKWLLISYVQIIRRELLSHVFEGSWHSTISAVIQSSLEDNIDVFIDEVMILCDQIGESYDKSEQSRNIDVSVLMKISVQLKDYTLFLLDKKKYKSHASETDDTFIHNDCIKQIFVLFQLLGHASRMEQW